MIFSGKASRVPDSPGLVVTDESGKEAPGFVPPHPESSQGKDDARITDQGRETCEFEHGELEQEKRSVA